ncbi:MAG: hypothetical protein ACJ8AI_33495 [Rhodopila sp.]
MRDGDRQRPGADQRGERLRLRHITARAVEGQADQAQRRRDGGQHGPQPIGVAGGDAAAAADHGFGGGDLRLHEVHCAGGLRGCEQAERTDTQARQRAAHRLGYHTVVLLPYR